MRGGAASRLPAAYPPPARQAAAAERAAFWACAAFSARRWPSALRPPMSAWRRFFWASGGGAARAGADPHGYCLDCRHCFRFDSDWAYSSLCFRFLPQKFPFFLQIVVCVAQTDALFQAPFWVSIHRAGGGHPDRASILSEAVWRRRAKIHNIFIIHEKLSYRNKNRLIRSIYLLSAPVHLIFSLIYVML